MWDGYVDPGGSHLAPRRGCEPLSGLLGSGRTLAYVVCAVNVRGSWLTRCSIIYVGLSGDFLAIYIVFLGI